MLDQKIKTIKKNALLREHKKISHQNHVKLAESFGSASKSYDLSARLHRFSGKHLMSWLPSEKQLTVLDLGSGTGFFTDLLATSYKQVIGLDFSKKMLHFAKNSRNKNISWLEADAYKIPLQDESIDFIYSNLVFQWFDPLDIAIKEMLRVLKPGGLIIFTTLVDGTLHELKSSWEKIDDDQHVIDFKTELQLEIHFNTEISTLLEYKCRDVILEYQNVIHLARELKGLGANHLPKKKNRGLLGKNKWFAMKEHYKRYLEPNAIYPATYRLYSGLVTKLNNSPN